MRIRKAFVSDLVQVNQLYFLLQKSQQHLRKIKMAGNQMENHFSEKDLLKILVADVGSELVGFVRVGEKGDNEWCGKCIELEEIFVLGKYQNQGVGKKLVKMAIKKYGRLHLMTHPKNKKAVDFYKKMGFKTIGLEMCD